MLLICIALKCSMFGSVAQLRNVPDAGSGPVGFQSLFMIENDGRKIYVIMYNLTFIECFIRLF